MPNEEMQQFRVDISRELGAITERLRSIDEHLIENKATSNAMWKKIDRNYRDIQTLKLKIGILSAVISFIVANYRAIIGLFIK